MWFSNDFENDNVFRTSRETRWRRVLLKRSTTACFTSFFSDGKGVASRAERLCRLPKSQCKRQRIVDTPQVKTATACGLLPHLLPQCRPRQSHGYRHQAPTIPTVCCLCYRQMTTTHHIELLTSPFFGTHINLAWYQGIFFVHIGL